MENLSVLRQNRLLELAQQRIVNLACEKMCFPDEE